MGNEVTSGIVDSTSGFIDSTADFLGSTTGSLLDVSKTGCRYGANTVAVDVAVNEQRRRRLLVRGNESKIALEWQTRGKAKVPSSSSQLAAGYRAALLASKATTRPHASFECRRVPRISIEDYMDRIMKYADASPEVLAAAVVYARRYIVRTGAGVDPRTSHRLLLACFVTAAKVRDDFFYANSHYAEVGGVTLGELNRMERALVLALDWDLALTPAELAAAREAPRSAPARD
eukprot:Hpha_TRINITY_DN13488_c0_g1::TRINITY_DN13488_c0_g1_i1::g.131364::m.131364